MGLQATVQGARCFPKGIEELHRDVGKVGWHTQDDMHPRLPQLQIVQTHFISPYVFIVRANIIAHYLFIVYGRHLSK